MSVPSHLGLFGFISRLGRPPSVDSDADLLDRFVRSGDENAFTGIVRRHGLMVLAVCRRRLAEEADAEDAFQAVFLALAKSARSIGQRESLSAWLYRVAYLISLKAAGIRARRKVVSWPEVEVSMPHQLTQPWESEELKNVIDDELARLPDKFRSVIALCLIEGRTNAEAASILGIPIGTIDSRLHTAKKRLGARLLRRGVAVASGISFSEFLGGPVTASNGTRILELIAHTVSAVLAETAGTAAGAVSPTVLNLAQGVSMMTTTRLRLLAMVGVAIGLLGGTATGIYLATAADPPNPNQAQGNKAQDPALAIVSPEKTVAVVVNSEPSIDSVLLSKPLKKLKLDAKGSVSIKELFTTIEDESDLIVRVDLREFRRLGLIETDGNDAFSPDLFLKEIYDRKIILPRLANRLPLRDVLSDSLAQIGGQKIVIYTYQIRGTQLVIIPSYQVPNKPGIDPLNPPPPSQPGQEEETTLLPSKLLFEQIYGGVVSVTVDKKPLTEILADLRKQTGANIVLDPRSQPQAQKAVLTVSLNDARLYDALRVIADLAELKMVYAGNIYYVTTPENAKAFQPPPVQRPIIYGVPGWPQQFYGQVPSPNIPPAVPGNQTPPNDPKKP